MKHLLLSGLASSLLVGNAVAADLPIYEPAPEMPMAASAPVWSGFYLGAHVGYGEAEFDGVFDSSELPGFPEETTFADELDVNGILGGLHVGYNWQMGMLLVSIEADVSFTDWEDSVADNGDDDIIEAEIDLLASARGRVGLALDRVLLYGTGGIAFAHGEATVIDDEGELTENSGSIDLDDVGLVLGVGTEVKLTDRWSMRAEGLYYWFDDDHDTSDLTDDSDVGDFISFDDTWVVRGGASFHF